MSDAPKKKPFPKALAHLKSLKGWVNWKLVTKANGKVTKPPFQSLAPSRHAQSNNPDTWASLADALATKNRGDAQGVGFMVMASPGEAWVDLDDCRNKETGVIAPWALEMAMSSGSYVEITPSQEGLRIVGTLEGDMADEPIHVAYKLPNGAKGEVFYRATRYVTITGNRLEGTPDVLVPINEIVSDILAKGTNTTRGVLGPVEAIPAGEEIPDDDLRAGLEGPLNLSTDQIRAYLNKLPPSDESDELGAMWWSRERWLHVLFALHDESRGSEEGYALLDEWCRKSAFYDPDGLRKTWNSARGSNNGDTRVTFKSVIKWGNDWTRPAREEKYVELLGLMRIVPTEAALADLRDKVRNLQVDDPLQRSTLISAYREAVKRLTGHSLSPVEAKKHVAYVDPDRGTMPSWLRPFVWITSRNGGVIYDSHVGQQYTVDAFNVVFARRFLTPEQIAQGETEPFPLPHRQATVLYQIPQVAGLAYEPYVEDDTGPDSLGEDDENEVDILNPVRRPRILTIGGKQYVNSYTTRDAVRAMPAPWSEETKNDIKQIIALYRRVCGTERDMRIILSMFRYILVTGKRVKFCPVIISAEGAGKTAAFVTIPGLMFGASNIGVYQPTAVTGSEQSWQINHLYKVIEELHVADGHKTRVIETMKPVITNDVVSPRLLYEGVRHAPNTASYVALTNHPDMLALTTNDTRFFPLAPRGVSTAKAMQALLIEDPGFYKRVHAAVQRSVGAFKWWLMHRFEPHEDFTAANGRAPDSDSKAEIIEDMRSDVTQAALDILEAESHPLLNTRVVCLTRLRAALYDRGVAVTDAQGRKDGSTEALARVVRSLGFASLGQVRLPASLVCRVGDEVDSRLDGQEGPGAADNRTRLYTDGTTPLSKCPKAALRLEIQEWADEWEVTGGL